MQGQHCHGPEKNDTPPEIVPSDISRKYSAARQRIETPRPNYANPWYDPILFSDAKYHAVPEGSNSKDEKNENQDRGAQSISMLWERSNTGEIAKENCLSCRTTWCLEAETIFIRGPALRIWICRPQISTLPILGAILYHVCLNMRTGKSLMASA